MLLIVDSRTVLQNNVFLGHFTQVVWKSSTEFGGAFATSSSGGTYVVSRFLPAGNINTKEQFQENVRPLK